MSAQHEESVPDAPQGAAPPRGGATAESIARGMFYLSCLALVFAAGVAVAEYHWFPYSAIQSGKRALQAVAGDAAIRLGLAHTEHAAPSRYPGAGVTINEPGGQVAGLTLLTGFFDGRNELRLMRADGAILHRWRPSFFAAFPTQAHVEPAMIAPQAEHNVEVHGALALPDGSVVLNFDGVGTVKLDRCGDIQWTVPRMTHHAVSRSADGGFWIPAFRYVGTTSRHPAIPPPYLEPTVVKVSAGGVVEQELSVLDMFFKSSLYPLLFANGLQGLALANKDEAMGWPNDVVHLNDVEELSPAMADAFPQFRPGSLLLSLRDYNMVLVADPQTLAIEWYQVGPWMAQHDADFTAAGTISVFSNHDDGSATGSLLGGSRIVEIDPRTRQSTVRYGGRAGQPFYTDVMGEHQNLGDNVVIAEARAGRVLEVNRQGHVVWEFINRLDDETVNAITGAARYPDSYFTVSDWSCPAR